MRAPDAGPLTGHIPTVDQLVEVIDHEINRRTFADSEVRRRAIARFAPVSNPGNAPVAAPRFPL